MSRGLRRAIAALVLAVITGLLPSTVRLPEAWQRANGPLHAISALWSSSTADAYYGTSRRVARRTSRRTSYRQNSMYNYGTYPGVGVGVGVAGAAAVGAAAVGTAAYLTTLPAGCTTVHQNGAVYQRCGSTMYQPLYQGDQLVYAPVE